MWVAVLAMMGCTPEPDIKDEPIDRSGEEGAKDPSQPNGSRSTIATSAGRERPLLRPASKVEFPSGTLVTRDCYASSKRERRPLRKRPTAAKPSRSSGYANSAPPPPPAAAPEASAAAESKSIQGALPQPGGSAPSPVSREGGSHRAKPAAPPQSPSRPHHEAPVEKRGRPSLDVDEEADTYEDGLAERSIPKPTWEYGATVYLSNDDSMSLASAQRLLWAVDQGRPFSPGEVRPHELLNYFSFDTNPPAQDHTFGVLGGAEQHGDTLSVALTVKGAMPARQPLDLTLVIDRSGSMRAEGRMEYVKKGLKKMTDSLRSGDRIDLVLFDSSVCTPVENFVVGRDDMTFLQREIDRMRPRGSTNLDGGLREGYRIQTARNAKDVHRRNRRVLLLTDAMLNTGNVNTALVSEIGERFENDGIRVTGVGVGRDFNDKMLNKITERGKGAYVYLGSPAVVDRVFGSGFDSLVRTVAHDVRFSIELPESLAMKKFYGEESSTVAADVQPINYYAGTSQVFLQDLKIREGGVKRSDPVTFRAKFRHADTGEPAEEVFRVTVGDLLDGDTHNLRKAQALMKWTDLLAARAMGDRRCTGLAAYRSAAAGVQGDAEVAYVSDLTGKLCGVDMSETVAATGVYYKVKVDSDLPIPEVRLVCAGESWTESLSGSDTVARFDSFAPGKCMVVLQGTVPMRAAVEVPSTGGAVRCLVRGGRIHCD